MKNAFLAQKWPLICKQSSVSVLLWRCCLMFFHDLGRKLTLHLYIKMAHVQVETIVIPHPFFRYQLSIFLEQVYGCFSYAKILSDTLSGFRKGHSTTSCCVVLLDDIEQEILILRGASPLYFVVYQMDA